MDQQHKFPVQAFRQTMEVTQKVKTKLQPFVAQFSKQNIVWMFGAISELQRIFRNPKQDIKIKFSSIFAVKVLFDLADVGLINLIEAYLLDSIQQIVMYKVDQNNEQKGMTYLIEKGYPSDTPQIEKFGYNYVRLAIQFVIAASQVRPKRLFENQQMRTPSGFALLYRKMTSAGFKPLQNLAYYKPNVIEQTRKKYVTNLQNFKDVSENYSNYFVKCADKLLTKGHHHQTSFSDPRKLFATGDVLITTDVIGRCSDALSCDNFTERTNSLLLLKDFIEWGDAEAYIAVNEDNYLTTIVKDILNADKSDTSLKRGRKLYPNIQGQEQQKYHFYVEFLRSLEAWAFCFEKDLMKPEKPSRINKLYRQLKQKANIVFPDNPFLKDYISHCAAGFNNNKQRTDRIFEEFTANLPPQSDVKYNQDQSKSSIKDLPPDSKKSISSVPKQEIKKSIPMPPQSKQSEMHIQIKEHSGTPSATPEWETSYQSIGVRYESVKKGIQNAERQIKAIPQSEKDLDRRMQYLASFREDFEKNIENLDQDSNSKFDQLFELGLKVTQKIDKVQAAYQKYKKNKACFDDVCVAAVGQAYKSKSQLKQQSPNRHNGSPKLKSESQIARSQFSIKAEQVHYNAGEPKRSQQKVQYIGNSYDHKLQPSHQAPDFKKGKEAFEETRNKPVIPGPSQAQSGLQQVVYKVNDAGYHHNSNQRGIQQNRQKSQPGSHHKIPSNSNSPSKHNLEPQKFSRSDIQSSIPSKDKIHTDKQAKISIGQDEQHIAYGHQKQFQKRTFDNERHSIKSIPSPSRKHAAHNQVHHSPVIEDEHVQRIDVMPGILHPKPGPQRQAFSFSPSTYSKNKPQFESQGQHSPYKHGMAQFHPYQHPQYPQKKQQQVKRISYNKQEHWQGQMDQFDQIQEPQLSPLNESYHDLNELHNKIKNDPVPSFKSCFASDQYLISSQNKTKKLEKLFWLQNDSSNLFKPSKETSRLHQSSTTSRVSIPQLLEERNSKYRNQLDYLEQEKKKHINLLQHKIKDLQHEGSHLKEKVTAQQREIKAMREMTDEDAMSRTNVNKYNYIEDQNALFKSKNKLAHQTQPMRFTPRKSIYSSSMSGQNNFILQNNGNNNYEKQYHSFPHQGKVVYLKNYEEYFRQYSKEREKRSLLKQKDLLLKIDGCIQIGCMSKRQGNLLLVTLYITPDKMLQDLHCNIQQVGQLRITQNLHHIDCIHPKKQQKITIEIDVLRVPYRLPIVTLCYMLGGVQEQKRITIPCTFNKFVETRGTSFDTLEKEFAFHKSKILKGQQVPYSKKILKQIGQISDYIPHTTAFNGGMPNERHELVFGGYGQFYKQEFYYRISVKPNQFLYIEGVDLSLQYGGLNALEQFICVMTHLLMKEITWKS